MALIIPQQPFMLLRIILIRLLLLPLPPLVVLSRRRSRSLGDNSLQRHGLMIIPVNASVPVSVVLVLFRVQRGVAGSGVS